MPLLAFLGPLLGLVCAGHLVRDGYLRRTVSPTESYPLSATSRSHSAHSRRRRHRHGVRERKARLRHSSSSDALASVRSGSPHGWARSRTPSSRVLRYDDRRAQKEESDANSSDSHGLRNARRSSKKRGRYYAQNAPYVAQSPSRSRRRGTIVHPATVAGMTAAAAATVAAAALGHSRNNSPDEQHHRGRSPGLAAAVNVPRTTSPWSRYHIPRSTQPDLETGLRRVPTMAESVVTVCTSSSCDTSDGEDTSGDSVGPVERERTWSQNRDHERAKQRSDRKEWRRQRERNKALKGSDELAISQGKN